MYQVNLDKSYFPAQTNLYVKEKTVGEVLSDAASREPDHIALVELFDDGSKGREWSYK